MQRSTRVTVPAALAALAVAVWAGGTAVAGAAEAPTADTSDVQTLAAGPGAAATIAANAADHDDEADYTWSDADVVPVTLTGSGATTSGTGISASGSVVTVSAAGTYEFSGSLTDGQIVVNTTATGIVRLILNGVTIDNSTTSAIQVIDAEEVMVVLADGSTNSISDASEYVFPDPAVEEPNAALFSASNLTITGTGSLDVSGNAYDGIASQDGLVIDSGTITVDAVDDAIRGHDYLVINGGTVTVTSDNDGLKSDDESDATRGYVYLAGGTVDITTVGDGVDAFTDLVTAGGVLTAVTGGGAGTALGDKSAKGLKAGVSVVVSEGQLSLDSADDGVNSDAAITIDGGSLTVATGDDGIHAETTLNISGGTVTVTRSVEGIEALQLNISGGTVDATASDDALNASEEGVDEFSNAPNARITISGGTVSVDGGTDGIDSNGTLSFTGGTVVVAGSGSRGGGEGGLDANGTLSIAGGTIVSYGVSASTSQLPSSGQGWVRVTFGSSQPAGTIVHIATTSGTQIATLQTTKAFQAVIFSSTAITRGTSYAIYTGGSVSGTEVGDGLYTGGTLSGNSVSTVVAGQ